LPCCRFFISAGTCECHEVCDTRLLVFCGKAILTDEHHDTITNPKVIMEVLSPSTADYDYGGKFSLYRHSLREVAILTGLT
jgi:Uma2 family endonuclease